MQRKGLGVRVGHIVCDFPSLFADKHNYFSLHLDTIDVTLSPHAQTLKEYSALKDLLQICSSVSRCSLKCVFSSPTISFWDLDCRADTCTVLGHGTFIPEKHIDVKLALLIPVDKIALLFPSLSQMLGLQDLSSPTLNSPFFRL